MTNRLSAEPSLYLRQHAGNPVDWYPWGEDAFVRSRERDCPVFVSVGYSACHWCHVMAHESFDSPRVAAFLNERFVSIKVDREERPDVDAVLMAAVQAMTGHGGWPLSVFLTPDGKVFHGGTYFPPEPRGSMPAFSDVLAAVAEAWAERRDDILAFAEALAAAVSRRDQHYGNAGGPSEDADGSPSALEGEPRDRTGAAAATVIGALPPARGAPDSTRDMLAAATKAMLGTEDRLNGGFGWSPKFPQSPALLFLLERAALHGDRSSLECATRALAAMATGGIHDQLAGGFHRYSVDERWVVPHFEKMLYDNALLLSAYVMAFQMTGSVRLRQVAHATAAYLLRDLRADGGAFCASTDADADGVEGSTYVWRQPDLDAVLAPREAAVAAAWYGITASGNFDGANVLTARTSLADAARSAGVGRDEAADILAAARPALLAHRNQRPQPVRDDKVVAVWNGLAIDALARAASALHWPAYGEAASRAARFIRSEMSRNGGLARMWAGGEARGHGFLEDYASLAGAAVTLWEWDFDPDWLTWACELTEGLLDRFDTDALGGGNGPLPRSGAEHGGRLGPDWEVFDSAEPSGNALAASALLRLGAITANERWTRRAERIVETTVGAVSSAPSASGGLLSAMARVAAGVATVSVIGDRADPWTTAVVESLRRRPLPGAVVGCRDLVTSSFPAVLSGTVGEGGRAAATVCHLGTCGPPLSDPAAVLAALGVPPMVTGPAVLPEADPCWPDPIAFP